MAGGERPSTEDDRWDGFMKGMKSVDAIERDEHEFTKGGVVELPAGRMLMPPPAHIEEPPIPEHSPLDEIAILVRTITYGEMIDLASEIWHFREVGEINSDTLPAILHGWAIQRGKSNGR